MQIGKSKAKVYIERKKGVTFQDVEGIEEAEEELAEAHAKVRECLAAHRQALEGVARVLLTPLPLAGRAGTRQ